MSFIVQAPHPLLQTTLVLPNPRTGNQKNLASSVQTLRSLNGKLYTFIKSKRGRMVHKWDFLGTKEKGQETVEFFKSYLGDLVRIVDHEGTEFVGHLTVNPLELIGNGRAGGQPSGEVYVWTISLEEDV